MSWRLFFPLWTAGLVGVVAGLPVLRAFVSAAVAAAGKASPHRRAFVLGVLAQYAILLLLVVGAGLWLSRRTGLRLPLLEAWAGSARPQADATALLVPALVLGLLTGAGLVLLDALLFARHLPAAFRALLDIPLRKRLLAGLLYGGITEELISRLFLMSLLVWLIGAVWRGPSGVPTPAAYWAAILAAALAFGALHLPATAALAPLTPRLAIRAIALNGAAGVVFGCLYWRRGLEAAMVAHMSSHLVLQGPGFALARALMANPPAANAP